MTALSPRAERESPSGVETSLKHFSVGSAYLRRGNLRLDGRNYSAESFWSQIVTSECGFRATTIADLAPRTFTPPRFKRLYVGYDNGHPYLSASELALARPPRSRFASTRISNFEQYLVEPGWILVSDSGTVGRTVLVSKRLAQFFVSNNAVRVIPEGSDIAGYVYAFLGSWLGQALLTKDQYGAVVQHIESFHVRKVPVPLLPKALRQRIHDDIIEAYRLRDEANDLLDQADELLHAELNLPRLDRSLVPYYGNGEVRAFGTSVGETRLRLDASFSDPLARHAIRNLSELHPKPTALGDIAPIIFNPPIFKRLFVDDPNHGIPYYTGAEIMHLKPTPTAFLARSMPNIQQYVVHQNWVLVTDSGTIGNVQFVDRSLDGGTVTNNVIRVCSDSLPQGYLYAFLASDYGQAQLLRYAYGAVIQHIEPDHVGEVLVPPAAESTRISIDKLVLKAFGNRAQANELENQAIKLLEDTLVEAYQKRTGRRILLR